MTNKLMELPQKTKLILGIFLIIISFIGLCVMAWGYLIKDDNNTLSYALLIGGFIFFAVGLGVGTPLLYYYKQQNDNVNCVVSWNKGSECVKGQKTYNANIITPAKGSGRPCGQLTRIEECDNDCVLEWGDWSECDKINGTRKRYSKIKSESYNKGKACPTTDQLLNDPQYSQTEFCPIDCELNNPVWISTSDCDKSCGGGTQTFKRNTLYPPLNGGKDCVDSNNNIIPETKTDSCNTQPCPIDCVVSDWNKGNWNNCNKTCGSGTQTRTNTRSIITQPQNGGLACPVLTQSETQVCNTQPCPIDCVVSDLIPGDWSNCDKNCGSGIQTRTNTRRIITPAQNGGICSITPNIVGATQTQTQTQSCNTQACLPVGTTNYMFKGINNTCFTNNGDTLLTTSCNPSDKKQRWNFTYVNKDLRNNRNRFLVKNESTGKCLLNNTNDIITSTTCDPKNINQLWGINNYPNGVIKLVGQFNESRNAEQCIANKNNQTNLTSWNCDDKFIDQLFTSIV
jgi:hypothetical protein